MSTRSLICVPKSDGIHCIYCDRDGFPSGVGKMLQHHYNSLEAAESLVALGDAVSIGTNVSESEFCSRDRGEEWADVEPQIAQTTEDVRELEQRVDAAYCYQWDLINGCWSYHRCYGNDRTERRVE